MVALHRVRTAFTGGPGGPGVSTMYVANGPTDGDAVWAMWDGLKTMIPDDISINVESEGDIVDSATGSLLGTWVGAAHVPLAGTGAGPYAAPVGGLIRWETGTVVDGHRLRGRTFIVPLLSVQFEDNGSLAATTVGYLQGAGDYLLTLAPGSVYVWHRPRAARAATATLPAVAYRAGSAAVVTAASVPDKAVVLRSRRD